MKRLRVHRRVRSVALVILGSLFSFVEWSVAFTPADALVAHGEAMLPLSFNLEGSAPPKVGLGGNDVGDVVWDGRWLWVGTGNGISKCIGGEGLHATDWKTYTHEQGLGRGTISAIAVSGDTIWVATITDTTIADESHQMGQGLSASFDGGNTWRHFTNEQIFAEFPYPPPHLSAANGCFGLAIDGETLWATFFAGSLVRTRDAGATWEQVLPDSVQPSSYDNFKLSLNYRTFCVVAYGDTVWVGTSSGIAKSGDGGATWIRFRSRADQEGRHIDSTIPGNWVVTLARQRIEGRTIIWAGTKSTGGTGEYNGVALTEDGGQTWRTPDLKQSTWNFAFRDSMVWAATDDGLYGSDDQGEHWNRVIIEDPIARERIDKDVVGIAVVGDTLWVGSHKGLARSIDLGETWTIIKVPVKTRSLDDGLHIGAMTKADSASTVRTYAFQNPFSPSQHEVVRIQYSLSHPADVTIRIYDFASRPVKTLIRDAGRTGPENHGENWDGKNDDGEVVANGVYFYRIETDRGDQGFGKIVVLE